MDQITSKFAMILLFVVLLSTLVTTLAFYQIEQSQYVQHEELKSGSQGKVRIHIEGANKPLFRLNHQIRDSGKIRIHMVNTE